jgi:hypothetical protein
MLFVLRRAGLRCGSSALRRASTAAHASMPAAARVPVLSAGEVSRYRADGFVVPEAFQLPEDEVARLRQTLDALIEANPGVRPEHLINAHLDGDGQGSADNVFFELARDPRILDVVEALIGPDIVLWGCHIFCKPAGTGMEVPWHQDGHYWPMDPLATCTVWVAIDESDAENGCLRVVPGSHREHFEHARDERKGLALNERAAVSAEIEARAVDLVLRPGQLSAHDVHILHASEPNRSDRRRAGVALRYMPASSHFRRDVGAEDGKGGRGLSVDFADRPIWLVRGRDASGRNDFERGHR